MPGRWAAPPAPAITTRRPRPAASCPKASISRGVRWAETTRTSWATPKRSSISTGALHHREVRRAAHHDRDEGSGTGRHRPHPFRERRARRAPGCRGPGRPTRPGPARSRRRPRTRSRGPVCARAVPPCHRGGRARPRRPGHGPSSRAGSSPAGPPKTLTLATWGAGAPSSRAGGPARPARGSRTARSRRPRSSSAPSCGAGSPPRSPGAGPPTRTARRHHADGAGDLGHLLAEGRRRVDHVGREPSRDQDLAAHAAHLRRLDRRPGGDAPEGRRATMTASSASRGTSSSTTTRPSTCARTASASASVA